MGIKLESLLRTLHPSITYKVFLNLHGLEMFNPHLLKEDEVKNYLEYDVRAIEDDFTIMIQAPYC